MLLIELFDRDSILCPEWLTNEYLEDDWQDSVYSYEEDKHTWSLKNQMKNVKITFDGETYVFTGYDPTGEIVILEEIITEDMVSIS